MSIKTEENKNKEEVELKDASEINNTHKLYESLHDELKNFKNDFKKLFEEYKQSTFDDIVKKLDTLKVEEKKTEEQKPQEEKPKNTSFEF